MRRGWLDLSRKSLRVAESIREPSKRPGRLPQATAEPPKAETDSPDPGRDRDQVPQRGRRLACCECYSTAKARPIAVPKQSANLNADCLGANMQRKPRPEDPRLETLLDERDHLQIQISLARDAQKISSGDLKAMHVRLAQLETELQRR